uniref:VWFA domain-containing protein n=1 Tax=Graphocephala atropunctata TaxID=36148 RepID=A0A1B6MHH4_9HEMI
MWWTVCLLLAGVWGSQADVEIKSLHMTTDILHRYASTAVSSRMVNPDDQMGEASFVVTYPDSAFITKFVIEANGKVYEAKIKNKEDVKDLDKENRNEDFPIFVRDCHQIAVSTKVEAHGEVRFLMDYEELLPRNSGDYSNVVTVNPGQIVEDLNLTVNIEETSAITTLEVQEFQDFNVEGKFKQSKLAKITEKNPSRKTIVWAPSPEQQRTINPKGVRGQLTVRYSLDQNLEHLQQYVIDNLNFVANFFTIDDLPSMRKHIIFVLDYSYSMEGQKLDELKKAMDIILSDLNSNDYFSIVLIQSIIEAWSPGALYRIRPESIDDYDREHMLKSKRLTPEFLVKASPANVAQARKYLQEADLGATYLIGGLKIGLKLANMGAEKWKVESNPPVSLIVFLSDREQSIGEINSDAIVDRVKALNIMKHPIFSLAFGYYADYEFFKKLSLSNYGSSRVIFEAANTTDQLVKFYRSVASPLLTNISISYFPTKVKNMTRSKFPLYLKGSEIVVAGKVKRDAVADLQTIGELSVTSTKGIHNYSLSDKKKFDGNSVTKLFEYLWITQMLNELESLLEFQDRQKIKESLLKMAIECTFFTTYTPLVVEKPDGSKSVVEVTPLKQAPPLEKVELMRIKWLQPYLTKGFSSAQVDVMIKDKKYNLSLHPTNDTFEICKVNRMAGECRHFQRCVLEIFQDDISDFLPYKCDIEGNFLGVCCPFHVS